MLVILFIIILIFPLSFILYILHSYSNCKNNSQVFINVQCWFCNYYHKVLKDLANCWDCPNCHQYNGFAKDGGYNKPILAQYDPALNAKCCSAKYDDAPPAASASQENNGLCDRCNANQCFKMAGLNKFSPRNQKNFDREYREYSRHLEQLYPLCVKCERFLRKKIEADKYLINYDPKNNPKIPSASRHQIKAPPPAQQCLAWLNFIMTCACLIADHYHLQSFGTKSTHSSLALLAHPELYRNFCRYIIHVGCLISFGIMYMGPPAPFHSYANRTGKRRLLEYRNKGLDIAILAAWFVCLITRSTAILSPPDVIYNLDKGLFVLCLVRLLRRSFLADKDSVKSASDTFYSGQSDGQYSSRSRAPKSTLSANLGTNVYSPSMVSSDLNSVFRATTINLSHLLNDSCSISGETPESVLSASTTRIPGNIFLQKPRLKLVSSSGPTTFCLSNQRFRNTSTSPKSNGSPLHTSVNTIPGTNTDHPIKSFSQLKSSPQHFSPTNRARLSGFGTERRTRPTIEPMDLGAMEEESSTLCDEALSSINGDSPESTGRCSNFERRTTLAPHEAFRAYALLHRREASWPTAGPMLLLFGLGLSVGINSVCAWIYLNRQYYNHLPY